MRNNGSPFHPSTVNFHRHIGVPIVLQPNRLRGLGRLGVGLPATGTNQATKTASLTAEGASIGTAIFPGIGTAIGAAIGAIGSLFGPAKEGQAAVTWDDMVSHGYLLNGTDPNSIDERYMGEAMKGAMDKGKNVWGTKCGADGHQNPDCFYGPLAQTIVRGYLNKVIPVSASIDQAWNSIVLPWLQSGAGGGINWNVLAGEPTQQALIKAAMNRYINGRPITRANMPAYAAQGGASTYGAFSQPDIVTALSSILNAPASAPVQNASPVVQSNTGSTVVAPASTPPKSTTQPAPVQTPIINNEQSIGVSQTAKMTTPSIPSGQGYNYAGIVVPVPSGYTLGPNGYIVDAAGYIFGSANDDALTAPVLASQTPASTYQPSYQSPTIVTVPSATTAVAAPTTDNTMLYLVGGAALLFVLMNKKK